MRFDLECALRGGVEFVHAGSLAAPTKESWSGWEVGVFAGIGFDGDLIRANVMSASHAFDRLTRHVAAN